MEKLITVRDVKERYGCSLPTARKYIRACNPHYENPLATTAEAFGEWEKSRMVYKTKKLTRKDFQDIERMIREGPITVPRDW